MQPGQMMIGWKTSECEEAVSNYYVTLSEPDWPDRPYRWSVPVEARVAICIWRLATNLEYRFISHLFGVGLSTCCTITQEIVTAINVVMKPLYIKHPSAAEFRQIWVFKTNGTHIKIRAPPDDSFCYHNRKGDHSRCGGPQNEILGH